MQLSSQPLISAARIDQRIRELASELRARFGKEEVVLLAVLKGALPFTADLLREMEEPVRLEFVRARSYEGTASAGPPEIVFVGEPNVAGAHVVVLDDILDTGRTTARILERLRDEKPASVTLCTLLDKPCRRLEPINADLAGFEIGDHFVVGYGLDYNERYRTLPAVYVLEE